MEAVALRGVSLQINEGEFVGIIGPTGSGKSTLIQHFNGLLRPTSGKLHVAGMDLTNPRTDFAQLRHQVGLLFQYPEDQLFEETVAKDVGFGPRNLKLPESEVARRVDEALRLVGLDPMQFGSRSPFSLSGGEMRRVAIAGVLAMTPRVLVLDEPAAGLDPQGKEEILGQIRSLHAREKLTVILVTHSMDEAAILVQRLVVMNRGTVVMDGAVRDIFSRADELVAVGLGIPRITDLLVRLNRRGVPTRTDALTIPEATGAILEALRWS
jgi:energy-coupling factor transport system ATP-binding protein